MLAGNAQDLVDAAIPTFIDWVDELILIDTGITDDTIRIAESLAKGKLHLTKYRWRDDFASARNFSLRIAQSRGARWVMTTDTDERFVHADGRTRDCLLESLESDPNVSAWMVRSQDGSYSKERFIRLPTELHWTGRTHEAMVGFGNTTRRDLPGMKFWEPTKSDAGRQQKLSRDIELLTADTVAHPGNPRWWYYLAQTHENLGRHATAAEHYRTCADLDGWEPESAGACFRGALCLNELGQFRAAQELAVLGLTRIPTSPELLWIVGFCAYQRQDFADAITWCESAVGQGAYRGNGFPADAETGIVFKHLPAWYEAPLDVLRFAYHQTGRPDASRRAEREFNQAKTIRLSIS